MIVRTFDGVQALTTPAPSWSSSSGGTLSLYDRNIAYGEMYRTQPNVRICVEFLARNIAQLGIHIFRRISDTDRERLANHELARWLSKPNPSTRRYRLIEGLVSDLGIYFEAFWLKVRYTDGAGRPSIGLVRLPPEQMHVDGGLLPSQFVWTAANGERREFAPSEIVYFNGYNPTNPLRGLSPLETLRRILAEEAAAGEYREAHWRHAGRRDGVIEQTDKAPNWNPEQQAQFRRQWQEFAGGGSKAGMTAVLPKGMTFKDATFSAKDSEFIQGGKLRREVCAAEYHIPQPMVGILEHATFSNIREQHKHTYQDCLAPWLEMITQEMEGQLLVECEDQRDVYTEFNIAAKLAGTFEERATALQVSVGRPWRTVNEARALENLPRDDDPESDRIAPQQGGPSDATANPERRRMEGGSPDAADARVGQILHASRARQFARLNKLPAEDRAAAFFTDADRWNRELTEDLTPIVGADEAARLAVQANGAVFAALSGLEAA